LQRWSLHPVDGLENHWLVQAYCLKWSRTPLSLLRQSFWRFPVYLD